MTVICTRCKKECKDYEFVNVDGDIKPICTSCTGRKKVMDSVVALEEAKFERAWNNKDIRLDGWFK